MAPAKCRSIVPPPIGTGNGGQQCPVIRHQVLGEQQYCLPQSPGHSGQQGPLQLGNGKFGCNRTPSTTHPKILDNSCSVTMHKDIDGQQCPRSTHQNWWQQWSAPLGTLKFWTTVTLPLHTRILVDNSAPARPPAMGGSSDPFPRHPEILDNSASATAHNDTHGHSAPAPLTSNGGLQWSSSLGTWTFWTIVALPL